MSTYTSEFIYGEELLGKPTALLPICEPETTKAGDTLSSRHVSSFDVTRAVGMCEAI
jgi:hypothetical protein